MRMRSHYTAIVHEFNQVFADWQVMLDYEHPTDATQPIEVTLIRRGLQDFTFQDARLSRLLLHHHMLITSFAVHYAKAQDVTYVTLLLNTVAVPKTLCLN